MKFNKYDVYNSTELFEEHWALDLAAAYCNSHQVIEGKEAGYYDCNGDFKGVSPHDKRGVFKYDPQQHYLIVIKDDSELRQAPFYKVVNKSECFSRNFYGEGLRACDIKEAKIKMYVYIGENPVEVTLNEIRKFECRNGDAFGVTRSDLKYPEMCFYIPREKLSKDNYELLN